MAHVTFIARALDGLILVETWDDNKNGVTNQLKQQAKQLLKKVAQGPTRCSIEGAGEFVFHYCMEDGVCYMALFDRSYPKKLAFAFLEDIHKSFQDELKREFGTGSVDYRSHIETIEKPYYFIKFDRQIQKKKLEYRDPSSSKALARLNENLTEVSSVMRKNIDDILQRGESLQAVTQKASDLKFASKEFKGMTRMLTLQTMLKKFGVPVVLGLVVLLVVYFKFFSGSSR
jgi:vesicle transport protein SEC22